MELLQPVERVRDQEVAHLVTAVVEHQGAPVGVLALARIGVFVQFGAVEQRQTPLVAWKVRGNPVEDHTDAALVELVDERPKIVRRAEPRCWRVVAGDLVPPRATERVLGYRKQLDVGEAHGLDVISDLVSELPI